MLRVGAHAQKPAVDRRMQGLHPTVHQLGKAGQVRHVLDGEARLGERPAGAAGGDEGDAALGERPGEVDEAGLVGHGQEGAGDALRIAGHHAGSGGGGAIA